MKLCCEDEKSLKFELAKNKKNLQKMSGVELSINLGSYWSRQLADYNRLMRSSLTLDGLGYTKAVLGEKVTIVDTNPLLRFLLDDIPEQADKFELLLISSKNQENKLLVPQVVQCI